MSEQVPQPLQPELITSQIPGTDGEKLSIEPEVLIILERHGKPYRPSNKPENPEELERVGKLDEEGIEETRLTASTKAREILSKQKPTTFFFLGSPSEYFIDGEAFGARAVDTAQVAARAVKETIDEAGLTPEQADVHFFGASKEATRTHSLLKEPDYFYVDDSQDPVAYFQALVDAFGREGREEGWLSIPEELEDVRRQVGAQSAQEVSDRIMKLVKVINRYAQYYAKKHPGRDLVFLMATHGDVMRAVTQYGFGAGEEATGYTYANNETIEIDAKGDQLSTTFNGKDYKVNL